MKTRIMLFLLAAIAVTLASGYADVPAGVGFGIATSLALVVAPVLRSFSLGEGFAGFTCETLEEQLATLTGDIVTRQKKTEADHKELTAKANEMFAAMQRGEAVAAETKRVVDEAMIKLNEALLAQKATEQALTELEQKAAKSSREQQTSKKGWGEQLIELKEYDRVKDRDFRGAQRFSLKEINRTSAAGLVRDPYNDTLVSLERRRMTIRDLLTVVPVSTESVKYAKQSVRDSQAAIVPEGDAKPYSNFEWTSATANIFVIAHLAKLTRQALMDAPRLATEVNSEMIYGLDYEEEDQLLNGSGVGDNMEGLYTAATAFAVPSGFTWPANPTAIDVIRVAKLIQALAKAPATGTVLNPVDWAMMEMAKDANNLYLFGKMQGDVVNTLWGLPVVETEAQGVGTFLSGAFKYAANLYDRMSTEVLISTENADDFEKNLATMRAERMVGLGIRRDYALTKGTFATIIAAATA